MTERFGALVIGAGMAGASLAAELGTDASVLRLEMEDQPGYRATGRSAGLIRGTGLPDELAASDFDPKAADPSRFRAA